MAAQAVLVANARWHDKSNDDKGGKNGDNDDSNDSGAPDDNRHNYGAHNDDVDGEVRGGCGGT